MIECFLEKFVKITKLKHRDIYRRDTQKYLTRHYIYRKPVDWMLSCYLHLFHSGDEDLELHDHPWDFSISLILWGSYKEERFDKNFNIITKIYKPGMINIIRGTDFHRVDLLTSKVWTLFISGRKKKNWGFIDRNTLKYWPWEEHSKHKKQ